MNFRACNDGEEEDGGVTERGETGWRRIWGRRAVVKRDEAVGVMVLGIVMCLELDVGIFST